MTKARTLADLIADGVVGNAELDDGSVTLAKIANGAISTDKIADDAVTAAKLNVQGSDIPYDNSTSGISANTLQEAIDYLNVLSGGGSAGAQATYTREEFNATAGQTTFTTTNGYTLGYLQVFLNGIMLDTSDYTANDESTVVLGTGAAAGDEVTTIAYDSFAISELLRVNSVSASAPDNALIINANGGLQLGTNQTGTGGAMLYTDRAGLGNNAGDYDVIHRIYQGNGNSSYLDTMQVRTSAGSTWNGAGYRIQQKIDSTWMGFIEFNGPVDGGVSIGTGLSTGSPNAIQRSVMVDQSGRVTMPYQPSFSASIGDGGSSRSVGVSGNSKIDTYEHYDAGSNFANGRFTAPVSGSYQINYNVEFQSTNGSTGRFGFAVRKNGSQYFAGIEYLDAGNAWDNASGSCVIPMSAGDYVELWTEAVPASGAIWYSSNPGGNGNFSGYLIG